MVSRKNASTNDWICRYLCLLLVPLHSFGLVRYGRIINTGNIVTRIAPEYLHHGNTSANNHSWYQVSIDSFTRYAGLDRLTLASQIRSYWDAEKSIADASQINVKNDLYLSLTTNLNVGFGVEWNHLSGGDVPTIVNESGYQYSIVIRWQW